MLHLHSGGSFRHIASCLLACSPFCHPANLIGLAAHETVSRGGQAACTVKTTNNPILCTLQVGQHPATLAFDASSGHLVVLDLGPTYRVTGAPKGAGSLHILDAGTGRVLRSVSVGILAPGQVLAVDGRRGRAFVLDQGLPGTASTGQQARLNVIDDAAGRVLRTISVGLTGAPSYSQAVAVDVQTGRVFVSNEQDNTVRVFEAATGRPLGTATVDAGARSMVIAERDRQVFLDNGDVLDQTGVVTSTIPVSDNIEAIAIDQRAGRVLLYLTGDRSGVAIGVADAATSDLLHRIPLVANLSGTIEVDDAIGRAVLVTTPSYYDAYNRGGPVAVRLLDTRSGQILRRTTLRFSTYSVYPAVAVDSRTNRAFVATQDINGSGMPVGHGTVYALNMRSGRILWRVQVGISPFYITVDQQDNRVFVANEHDGTITVLNASGRYR